MKNKSIKLEDLLLAHRYLYYLGEAVISDYDRDNLEKAVSILIPNRIIPTQVGVETKDMKIIDLSAKLKRGMYKLENLIYHIT